MSSQQHAQLFVSLHQLNFWEKVSNCKDENKIYAKLELKSFLTDNGEHKFDIPHNSVSGFVIAIKNK